MGQDLAGKVAVITGGAAGIGRATAELFVAEGARVVIADVAADRGEEIAARLGDTARFKATDVSDREQMQALVDYAVAEFGGLNIMFNNAGIGGSHHKRFLDDELQDFRRIIDINLWGVMLGTQLAGRHMAKHGGGSIINTASIAGSVAGYGVVTYRASKAAVIHFSKSVSIDLAEHNIRVNCLTPGHIPTELNSFAASGTEARKLEHITEALRPVWAASRPLKRIGMPADVAQAALYLASDRSQYVTGIVMPIDGGVSTGDAVNHLQALMDTRTKAIEEFEAEIADET
jgi:NAD(P)-dependent dehydrogenase (short-subunit alcohol dehydrogenase family)